MANYGYTIIKNPEIIPKLSEVLDLILKKVQSGSKTAYDGYVFDKSVLYKKCTLGKRSASLINDSLLNHRFEEAAKILWIMCQDRSSFNLFLYKGIMVVLENLLLNHEDESVKAFFRDIKSLQYVNKLEVQLEYLIYALKNNNHDLDESLKGRKRKIKIIPYIEQLHSAYSALVNYITWTNISQGESSSKGESDIAFNVIACFKKLIDYPGIWDIFILKLIEMLEYYEKYEEIEELLKKYIERNPDHVNGYIYICVHLHKHNTDPNVFIHYAKVLVDICPSDERVLLLVQKWDELGKYLKKRLKILFMFLDYPVNGNKMLGWQLLSSHLTQALSSKKTSTTKVVKSSWDLRCQSWNYMHFASANIFSENSELLLCKVKVLSFLNPNHEYITIVQEKFQQVGNQQPMNSETTLPTSDDFYSLYDLDDISR